MPQQIKVSGGTEGATAIETRSLRSLDLSTEYRTGKSDLIAEFFRPCLEQSDRYDRGVGFFRSTIFHVVGQDLIDFARRGGSIRLICSPVLTHEDAEAIGRGYERRDQLLSDIIEKELHSLSDEQFGKERTRALATLIAVNSLDLKIAVRPPKYGPYHEKIGLFVDQEGNLVSFKGSSNESWSGWDGSGNFESIEVFCSWSGGNDSKRTQKHEAYFEHLWNDRIDDISVYNFPAAAKERLIELAANDLDSLSFNSQPESASQKIRDPLPHQASAIENWENQDKRGILEHATGSGKTFTAILAVREHIKPGGVSLILVPSRLLLKQWRKELQTWIPEATLLLAGDGNNRWRRGRRLRNFTNPRADLGPRIVLATMQTACINEFRNLICSGEHIFVVGDEVHRTGSSNISSVLTIETGPRLGLSATPRRFGDPEGTRAILDYFGPVVQPIFTLADAISAGRLVPYEYFPHTVHLTKEEADEWREMTERIKRQWARISENDRKTRTIPDQLKLALIQRARIAKKAARKTDLAVEVVKSNYEKDQRWLVYCEDKDQLNLILNGLRQLGYPVNEYHTAMEGCQDASLDWFTKFGGILVSIRCLDEGVDIPDISHALILASSQNPRQFIQRRGRVLRKADNKTLAVVHDAIVVPVNIEDEPEQTALLESELVRAMEFARSSINRSAGAELRDIAVRLGIDPATLIDTGVEEDLEDEELG